ncbi:hypothetical protein B0J13DRAFT_663527 [Dactylonectria estremocensis]|uniref:C2H2-type domain-containing protein n=1 Tax=Dactylonectria estremocensis TaxID=1079267 RepID=A0A9P9CYY0_9HYPO|nr:hypothetical protein B0J13DRAFT_663527 [Dactylonectria estremocensis]
MAQTSLDLRSGDATPIKTLMEYPSFQSLHPISPNLLNASFSKLNIETTRVPPSPSTESDDSDPVIGKTIVCAPFPLLPVNFTQNDTTEHDWHQNATPATRSISFDEVFQDGKAPAKQIIIQFPNSDGSWFILRCDEHDHDFMYPPLRGAAAHLRSKKHGWLRNPSNAVIVEHFGIEVLNCNAELAKKNNSIAFKAGQGSRKRSIARITDGMPGRRTSGSEKRPKFTTKGCNRTGVDRHGGLKRQSNQRRHEGIPSPIPGRIYLAYWEMTRDWLPVLLLPHIALEEFGVPSTLESLGLIDHIPECFEYDPETKDLKWKKGYEHGGPRVTEREFPMIYFDGDKFPEGSPADWVRVGDLQELNVFDALPRLVPNLKSAKNYLRRRIEKEADAASSLVLSDIESDSETTFSSCAAGSGSPIISASDGMVPLTMELAAEPFSQEREDSLSPNVQSEVFSQEPQLEQRDRSYHESAPEPELGSAPNAEQPISTGAPSRMADPEVISIPSSEDEMSDKGQLNTANEPPSVQPANDTMQIDSGDSTRNNDNGTTQSNDPSPSPVHIHQRQIQRALSNHMAADLLNLKTKSIDLKFPKAIQGIGTTQTQLPPARPPTAQWHAGVLVPPDNEPTSPTSSCHHMQMSVSQKPNDSMTYTEVPKTSLSGTFRTIKPNPPITASGPTGRPQVVMPRDADNRTTYVPLSKVSQRIFCTLTSKPPVTAPTSGSQSREPGIPRGQVPSTQPDTGAFVPVNTEANSSACPVGQIQAPKLQTPQVPTTHVPSVNTDVVARSHPGTLYLIREQPSVGSSNKSPLKPLVRVPFPHNIQLQRGEPRFGQPPHEVPPYFLDRLLELTGSQDENPPISAFLTKGLYLCPWCQKKYGRTVRFTDHLVLSHSRSPDPKQGPIVSWAELDSGVDSDIIDLTSES